MPSWQHKISFGHAYIHIAPCARPSGCASRRLHFGHALVLWPPPHAQFTLTRILNLSTDFSHIHSCMPCRSSSPIWRSHTDRVEIEGWGNGCTKCVPDDHSLHELFQPKLFSNHQLTSPSRSQHAGHFFQSHQENSRRLPRRHETSQSQWPNQHTNTLINTHVFAQWPTPHTRPLTSVFCSSPIPPGVILSATPWVSQELYIATNKLDSLAGVQKLSTLTASPAITLPNTCVS